MSISLWQKKKKKNMNYSANDEDGSTEKLTKIDSKQGKDEKIKGKIKFFKRTRGNK